MSWSWSAESISLSLYSLRGSELAFLIVLAAFPLSLAMLSSAIILRLSTMNSVSRGPAGVVLGMLAAVASLLVDDGSAGEPSFGTHSLVTLMQFWQLGLSSSHLT